MPKIQPCKAEEKKCKETTKSPCKTEEKKCKETTKSSCKAEGKKCKETTKSPCKTEEKKCKETTKSPCKTEDKKCKEMNRCRCGTGDTGCKGPAMNHMSDSMCNGVFAPVCAPEVCNVPRIPHKETLVEGKGVLLDNESQQRIRFNIFVEREMQVYRGSLKLQGTKGGIKINACVLKFFEGDGKSKILAIFHEICTEKDIMVVVQKGKEGEQEHKQEPTQIFIYSAPIEIGLIHLGGEVISGEIHFYADHNVHEH